MEALELRPEAMWTHQSTGSPNGWVAVLIFVMNLCVNILGENGNRQEMEGTGRSHPGVYFGETLKCLTVPCFFFGSCM